MTTTIAFTAADLTAILAACRELRGQTFANGVDRGLWLEAFVRLAWETGLRQDDLINLEWGQLDDDGTLRVAQAKDGVEFVCRLSQETIAAVRTIGRPDDRLVFTAEGRSAPTEWKALLRRAGVDDGGLSQLRSSALRRRLAE